MGGDASLLGLDGAVQAREDQETLLQVAAALQEVPRHVQASREGRARGAPGHAPLRRRARYQQEDAQGRSGPLASISCGRMATCLVTGGAGFLGSHLCDELLARGNRVICVDSLETGSLMNIEHIRVPEFTFLQKDIVEPYFVDEQVDFVYHLASPASPIDYLRLPLHTLKVGSYGTHHTLGLAKAHRARFLIAS